MFAIKYRYFRINWKYHITIIILEMAQGGLWTSDLFTLIKPLGGGGFGIAYLVQHKHYGEIVFKKIEASNDIDDARFQHETEVHKHLRHPNIVNFLDVYSVERTCGLFIEYMTHGDATDFIKEFDVTWQWRTKIVHDVAQAMVYLHSRLPCIIHGDLKPENILIDERYRAKVSDFGLACIQILQQSEAGIPHNGTLPYIAPEYLEDRSKQKTPQFDVYGFAISVWEIYSGKRHSDDFQVASLTKQFVINGTRPLISDITSVHRIPDSILQLMEQCWNELVQSRPSFEEILNILLNEFHQIGDIIFPDHIKTRNHKPSGSQFEQTIPRLDLWECKNPKETATGAKKVGIKTEGDRQQFLKGFDAVCFSLLKYIDSENGLLECLLKYGILTMTDYNVLNDITPQKRRNSMLILNYIKPKIKDCCILFVDALVEDKQEHIVTHIMSSGMNQGDDRLLTDDEIEIIDNNMFGLVNLIHPYKMEFLYRLVSRNCITSTHKETIESHKEFTKKVDELLTILKRRRYRDLCSFKQCLHDTMQRKIVELFEKSGLVAIHVELVKRPDITFIESALIAHMTDYIEENNEKTLTSEQRQFVDHILQELEMANIRLLGTSSWHSMAVFFMCSSANSLQAIHEIFESGKLKKILEKVHRVFYKLPDCAPDLIEKISLHELPFQQISSSSG